MLFPFPVKISVPFPQSIVNVLTLKPSHVTVDVTGLIPEIGVTVIPLQTGASIGSQVFVSQPPVPHPVLDVSLGSQVSPFEVSNTPSPQ